MSYLETAHAHPEYRQEKQACIAGFATDQEFREPTIAWRCAGTRYEQSSWAGRLLINRLWTPWLM